MTEERNFITDWIENTAELRGDFELPLRSNDRREYPSAPSRPETSQTSGKRT